MTDSSHEDEAATEEVFTSSDPNFWDYVRLKDFTKKTGIEEKDCHAFCLKELLDNAADFIEKFRYSNGVIAVNINNDNNNNGLMTISVSNSNPGDKPAFRNLDQTFDYKQSYSSKSNQYRITRGAQGDALKELGTMGYMLTNNGEDGEDKSWSHAIVFQYNKEVDKTYIEVDRKHRTIKRRFEHSTCIDIDTKVTILLPAIDKTKYLSFKGFFLEYTLFNTHLSFDVYFNGEHIRYLSSLLPMSEDYDNPNSIRCYSQIEFADFLSDLHDKNMTVYAALKRSEFREINQPGRFEDLKNIIIEQLTPSIISEIYKRLRKSMLPMSELSTPYQHRHKKRKEALIDRYRLITSPQLQLDYDNAKYQRTDPKHTIYDNGTIRYPYTFEVLAIPIKNPDQNKSIVISGVNYSTSINNRSYFSADSYKSGYAWGNKNGTRLSALNIEEIVKVSSAGQDLSYDQNIQSRKQRQPCVVIAHLISPRPEYKHGYGKSTLKLEPYAIRIAQTIEDLVKRIPLRNRIKPSKEYEGPTGCLDDLLRKRWDDVRRNPGILDVYSPDYDPWTQSTVWYHLREEYLLPIETRFNVVMMKDNTRKDVTAMISERCEKLEGSPTREQLGIFASPRATMYINEQWFRVDIDNIPDLAGKGTDVIFIEKQGIVEIIKHLADIYGIAFVNTQGHFAEYPRNLVPEIIENGGNVVILTDFDCAGIHIAERIITEDVYREMIDQDGNSVSELNEGVEYTTKIHYGRRVKRLGVDFDTINYFVSKVEDGEIEGIKVEVRSEDDDDEFVEKLITTREELQKYVEEPYPKAEGKENKQQPGMNVITAVIKYAKKYLLSVKYGTIDTVQRRYEKYERYKYIYDNFEYLTGLNLDAVIESIHEDDGDTLDNYERDAINELLRDRDPTKARRIELDSIIKVVRANLFAEFVLNKLQEFFPERDYNRAIKLPTEYFADKFHILPEKTKQLFLYYVAIADKAAKPTEEEIEEELEHWSPNDEEIEQGIPVLLKKHDEDALNEMLTSKVVANNPEMQELGKKAGELLDSLRSLDSNEQQEKQEDSG